MPFLDKTIYIKNSDLKIKKYHYKLKKYHPKLRFSYLTPVCLSKDENLKHALIELLLRLKRFVQVQSLLRLSLLSLNSRYFWNPPLHILKQRFDSLSEHDAFQDVFKTMAHSDHGMPRWILKISRIQKWSNLSEPFQPQLILSRLETEHSYFFQSTYCSMEYSECYS